MLYLNFSLLFETKFDWLADCPDFMRVVSPVSQASFLIHRSIALYANVAFMKQSCICA